MSLLGRGCCGVFSLFLAVLGCCRERDATGLWQRIAQVACEMVLCFWVFSREMQDSHSAAVV